MNRALSRPLTALLLKTPITPNGITLLSLLFGISGGLLFSRGAYGAGLAAAACYELATVLDNCDGEVARAKNLKSAFGAWLDVIVDVLNDVALFLGIAVGTLKTQNPSLVLTLAALCVSGTLLHFLLVILEKLKGFGPAVFGTPNPNAAARGSFFFKIFDGLREGEASWFVVGFAIIGQTAILLWVGAVYMQAIWIGALLLNFRWIIKKGIHESV
ncbi:MAG: CDP-alcohol phosphatidyltransferase family protein [Candidatus Omnitrophica bacterium]|nr:CDP-alcohol phosphatidyltransferase family protein [Candidatus Omnitrophota bacterium]